MSLVGGNWFCASPMRPLRRSPRICSCCTASKPSSSSSDCSLVPVPSCVRERGSRRSKSVCTMPESSGRVRQAAAK
jgi:hypothetical protein